MKNVYASRWMYDMRSHIKDTPLYNLKIPATHNSATYNISDKSIVSIDTQYDTSLGLIALVQANLPVYGLTPTYTQQWLHPWMKNQECNILQQLKHGIRLLDIRLCSNKHSNVNLRYTSCHGFVGSYLPEIFNQIVSFITSNSNEVVIVDVNHLYGFNMQSDVDGFLYLVSTILNDTLIDPKVFNSTSTLSNIWKTKQRVFLYVNHNMVNTYGDQYRLFKSSNINTPWANVQDMVSLKSALLQQVKSRPNDGRFFVSQGVMTPDLNMIVNHTIHGYGVVRDIAYDNYGVIGDWYKQWPKNATNVCNTDFYNLHKKKFIGNILKENLC